MAKRGVLLVVIFLLVVPAGCGKGAGRGNLNKALAMMPADVEEVYFTDWALIKAYEGKQGVNSESSLEERFEFLKCTNERQAAASGFGTGHFYTFAETWSWDTTDLEWEASSALARPTLYILKLRDDFDLSPVLARFEERGFEESTYRDTPIYSHDQNLLEEWFRGTGELAILNTAVIETEKLLVLSADIDAVHAVLDVYRGKATALGEDEAVRAAAGRLGEVAAAVLDQGFCARTGAARILEDLRRIPESDRERVEELMERYGLDQDPRIHQYEVLGMGYRQEDGKPLGLIVLQYAQADDAQADLEIRRQGIEEGHSIAFSGPYSERAFTLKDASVQGTSLVFQVNPVNEMPKRLFQMYFNLDLLFASCP